MPATTTSRRARRPPPRLGPGSIESAVGSIESATERALSALLRRSLRRQRRALAAAAAAAERPPPDVVYACAACAKAFESDTALRQHWRRRHAAAAAPAGPEPAAPPPPGGGDGSPRLAEQALTALAHELAELRRQFAGSIVERSGGSLRGLGASSGSPRELEPTDAPPPTATAAAAAARALRRELESLREVGDRRDELLLDATAASKHALQRLQAQVDELRAAVEAAPRGGAVAPPPPQPPPTWALPAYYAAAASTGRGPGLPPPGAWWPEQPLGAAAAAPPPPPSPCADGGYPAGGRTAGPAAAAATTPVPAPPDGAWQPCAREPRGEGRGGEPMRVAGADQQPGDGEWKARARALQRQLAAARADHADAARRAASLGASTAAMRALAASTPSPVPPADDALTLLVPSLAKRRAPAAAAAAAAGGGGVGLGAGVFRLSYQWQRLPPSPASWAGSANCASLLDVDAGAAGGQPGGGVGASWAALLPAETHVSDTNPVRVRVPPSWELVLAVPLPPPPPPPPLPPRAARGGSVADDGAAWAHTAAGALPAHVHVTVHRTMTLREVHNAIADQLGLPDTVPVRVALCGAGGSSSLPVELEDGTSVEEAALFCQRPVLAWRPPAPMAAPPPREQTRATAVSEAAEEDGVGARPCSRRGAGRSAAPPPELPAGAARVIAPVAAPTAAASPAASSHAGGGAAVVRGRSAAASSGAAAAPRTAGGAATATSASDDGLPTAAASPAAAVDPSVVRPHKVAALRRSISRNLRDVLDVLVRSGSSVAGGAGSSSVRSASARAAAGAASSSSVHSRRGSSAHAFPATAAAVAAAVTAAAAATAGAAAADHTGGGGGSAVDSHREQRESAALGAVAADSHGAAARSAAAAVAPPGSPRVAAPRVVATRMPNAAVEGRGGLKRGALLGQQQHAPAPAHHDDAQPLAASREPASESSSAPAHYHHPHHLDRTITEISALSELDAGSVIDGDGCNDGDGCDDRDGNCDDGGTQLLPIEPPAIPSAGRHTGLPSVAVLPGASAVRLSTATTVNSPLPPLSSDVDDGSPQQSPLGSPLPPTDAQPPEAAATLAPPSWAIQGSGAVGSGGAAAHVASRQPSFSEMTLDFDLGDGGVHAPGARTGPSGSVPDDAGGSGSPQQLPSSPPVVAAAGGARVLRSDASEVLPVHAAPAASLSSAALAAGAAGLLWERPRARAGDECSSGEGDGDVALAGAAAGAHWQLPALDSPAGFDVDEVGQPGEPAYARPKTAAHARAY